LFVSPCVKEDMELWLLLLITFLVIALSIILPIFATFRRSI